jgi:hypothetical protein
MELIFSVLLGVIALWALWKASQYLRTAGVVAGGFVLIAVSAVIQILNLTGSVGMVYSVVLSVLTTVGLVGGFALTRLRVAGSKAD